jgi:hypothetical protein
LIVLLILLAKFKKNLKNLPITLAILLNTPLTTLNPAVNIPAIPFKEEPIPTVEAETLFCAVAADIATVLNPVLASIAIPANIALDLLLTIEALNAFIAALALTNDLVNFEESALRWTTKLPRFMLPIISFLKAQQRMI